MTDVEMIDSSKKAEEETKDKPAVEKEPDDMFYGKFPPDIAKC